MSKILARQMLASVGEFENQQSVAILARDLRSVGVTLAKETVVDEEGNEFEVDVPDERPMAISVGGVRKACRDFLNNCERAENEALMAQQDATENGEGIQPKSFVNEPGDHDYAMPLTEKPSDEAIG